MANAGWIVFERLARPFRSFRELTHASWITVLAFIPALAVMGILETSLPRQAVTRMCYIDPSALTGNNYAPLLNYYIAWVTHCLTSLGIAFFAARSAFRNMPMEKVTVVKRFRTMVFLIALLVVLFADAVHCALAKFSHERLFNVLSAESSLSPLFQRGRQIAGYSISTPTIFSFFPMAAIAAAFWAATTIILCASRFLVEFERTDTDVDVEKRVGAFSDAMEELRSHLTALSVVLVTSTLTTVAYLRTPLGFLGVTRRDEFRAMTDAVGLAWGVTFSLILLAICVYPFLVLRESFNGLARDADGMNHGEVLATWVRQNRLVLQIPGNIQMVFSVLLPATVAVLAHLVPS